MKLIIQTETVLLYQHDEAEKLQPDAVQELYDMYGKRDVKRYELVFDNGVTIEDVSDLDSIDPEQVKEQIVTLYP
jgi:hypothetical protein